MTSLSLSRIIAHTPAQDSFITS